MGPKQIVKAIGDSSERRQPLIFDSLKTESNGGVDGHTDDSKREAPTSQAPPDQLGLAIGVERRAAMP